MNRDGANPARRRRVWAWIVACVVGCGAFAYTNFQHSFWFDRTSGFMTGTYKIAGVRVWSYARPTLVSEMLGSTYDASVEDRRYVGTSFFGGVACGRGGSYMALCHNAADSIRRLEMPDASARLLRLAIRRLDDVLSRDRDALVWFDVDAADDSVVARGPDGSIVFRVSPVDGTSQHDHGD